MGPAPAARARVVPQDAVEVERYLGTTSDRTFAFFEEAIVDLKNQRLAWITDLTIPLPKIATTPGHGVRIYPDGVERFNLLDGTTVRFPGELVAHCGTRGYFAVRKDATVDVIDATKARSIAKLPVVGDVLSVMTVRREWLCADSLISANSRITSAPSRSLRRTPPSTLTPTRAESRND